MGKNSNENLAKIEKELNERNQMHAKLLDIIRDKDAQIDKLLDMLK